MVAKADDKKILLQAPNEPRPSLLTREQFEALWNRELVLMTRRGSLLHFARRINISWFMGAIWKYRRMVTKVMVASRLFRHLLTLPMAYFRARRGGDSVARVRASSKTSGTSSPAKPLQKFSYCGSPIVQGPPLAAAA